LVDANRIGAFPIFANLPAAELDALAATTTEVVIDAGAEVVTLDDWFVAGEGRVRQAQHLPIVIAALPCAAPRAAPS